MEVLITIHTFLSLSRKARGRGVDYHDETGRHDQISATVSNQAGIRRAKVNVPQAGAVPDEVELSTKRGKTKRRQKLMPQPTAIIAGRWGITKTYTSSALEPSALDFDRGDGN